MGEIDPLPRDSSAQGQRLFIINRFNYGSNSPTVNMGIALPSAKVGDFIWYFYTMEKAAVVRRERGGRRGDICRLIGIAVLGNYFAHSDRNDRKVTA
jgi:hypothetical protein